VLRVQHQRALIAALCLSFMGAVYDRPRLGWDVVDGHKPPRCSEILHQHDVTDALLPVDDDGFSVRSPRRAKQNTKILRKLNSQPPVAGFRIDDPDRIAGSRSNPLSVG